MPCFLSPPPPAAGHCGRAACVLALAGGWLALAAPALAGGPRMYRWVDAQGQVHYGDAVPAQAAGRGRDTLDPAGRITARTAREATTAERTASAAAAARAAAEAKATAEQDRYDKLLVQTYDTEAALAAARDERLAALDTRLAVSRRNDADAAQVMAELKTRLARTPRNEKLAAQIAERQRISTENQRAVAAMQAERQQTVQRFDEDLVRYRRLRSATAGPRS